jgi:outer membrane biosynthesis protein TonB
VVHQEIPAVSRGARESIRGQIKVAVRVSVDRAGNVVAENLQVHGSSNYFARLASDAAKKWKFTPADNPSPREWLLQFEFARSGVTAQAAPRRQ